LVPLAPLTDVSEADLPEVVRRMADRINAEPRERAAKLWTATFLLMGLRYSDEMTLKLLEGVQTMRESTTYQWILKEGRNEGRISEAQRLLVLQGEIRFGTADGRIRGDIEAIRDLEHLEMLSRRLFDANIHDWDGLLRKS
jgi:predicted transposase YdaD